MRSTNTLVRTLVLANVFLVAACGRKPAEPPVADEPAAVEGEFTAHDWEQLTDDLLAAGRAESEDAFKSRMAPQTVEVIEALWKRIVARAEFGLAIPNLDPGDRKKLEFVRDGCNWKPFAKSYRPGRLVTINALEAGRYQVTEVLPRTGRKVDYLVFEKDGTWVMLWQKENRWLVQVETSVTEAIDKMLLRYGVDPASTAPPVPPSDAAASAPEPAAG